MCNASQGIVNEVLNELEAEGVKRGKIEVYYCEMQLSPKEISLRLGIEENEIREIIREMGW